MHVAKHYTHTLLASPIINLSSLLNTIGLKLLKRMALEQYINIYGKTYTYLLLIITTMHMHVHSKRKQHLQTVG